MRTDILTLIRSKPAAERSGYTGLEVTLFLVALVIGIAVLSVFFFTNQSIRLDEAQSLWQTSHSMTTMFRIVAEDVHVPLYHILLHYWQLFFGQTVQAARILSLVFYAGMIVATFFLGKKAFSTGIGLFAALLIALSPFLNWYGNEVRMYTIFGFMTILNQFFFIQTFDQERTEKVNKKVWVGYSITLIIGLFTHYFFALNVIAQAVFYFMYKKAFEHEAWKKFLIILLIAAVCFSPWLYFVFTLGSARNTQPQLTQPTSIDLFNTFFQFIYGFQPDKTNTLIISLWPLLVLMIFLFMRRHQGVPPQAAFFLVSIILPIVVTFAVSAVYKPIYLSRYLILTLPSLYLLLSWAISTYSERISRIFKTVLIASMALMLVSQIANANASVKEDYRSASTYLEANATPKDIIVLSAPFTIYPFEYYYQGPTAVKTLPIWNRYIEGPIPNFNSDELVTDASTLVDSHQYLWLLLSYDQGYEEQIRLYFDTRYERVVTKEFTPGIHLYGYKLRYDQQAVSEAAKLR